MALVVGNATYEHASALATPLNDAADIGAALERLGFTVTRIDDAGQGELRRSLHEFAMAAGAAETAVLYYAGHGIAVEGRNFLVPVDARLSSAQDIEFETVPLELVERAAGRASGVRLIILDACRESPFEASMQRHEAYGPIRPGLAAIEPSAGTLVVYAAKEGTVALHGPGRNSPYSGALLRYLEEPGVEVEQMFRKVHDAVLAATAGSQEPSVYGSLPGGKTAYLGAKPASSAEAPATTTPTESGTADDLLTAEKLAAERLYWVSVKDSDDPAEIQTYLDQYPSGTYAALARTRLKRLGGETVSASPDAGSNSDAPAPAETGSETPPGLAEQHPPLDPEAAEEALGLQPDHRRLIQSGLALLGFDPGPADGVIGQRTRAAIGRWQASVGKPATGYLNLEAAKILARRGTEAPPPSNQPERSAQAAMETLTKALQTAGQIDNHSVRADVLASIGTVLAKAGDSRRAAQSFELASAAARRIEDESYSLPKIAEIQAAAGDVGGAARSIRLAMASAQREDSEYSRDVSYGEIVEAQVSAGDIQGALATVQRIDDQLGLDFALKNISQAQVSAGDIQGALATVQRIDDQLWLDFALENIAVTQASAGDIQAALATAQRIEHEATQGWTLAEIAGAQATAGDVQAALAIAQRIEIEGGQALAFVNIAEARAAANDVAGATKFIERSLVNAHRIEFEDNRSYVLTRIAKAQTLTGDTRGAEQSFEHALASAEKIADYASLRNQTLSEISTILAEIGDISAALEVAERIDDESARSLALTRIAAAQLGVEVRF